MFQSVNPATGQEIATYPELTTEEVGVKLDKAVRAFAHWRTAGIAERAALLARIADQYHANKDRLARVATKEMGKTYASSLAEVEKCAAAFCHYAKHGPQMLEPQSYELSGGGTAELHWLPLGPVLADHALELPVLAGGALPRPDDPCGNVGLLKHARIVQGVAGLMERWCLRPAGRKDRSRTSRSNLVL